MSGQMTVNPSAGRIARLARKNGKSRELPPVQDWDPPFHGDLDIRIARDGTWYHEGSPINRPELVRLFSTILRKEGSRFFLVTPVEKVGIEVEDAPFIATDFEREGQGRAQRLVFHTNVGDEAVASTDHPIRVDINAQTGEPAPYVLIRAGLEARIDRKSFYRLTDIGTHEDWRGESWFGVWSKGVFFRFARTSTLAAPQDAD